ncbi:transposase [Pirellulaceae bacterium SH449]
MSIGVRKSSVDRSSASNSTEEVGRNQTDQVNLLKDSLEWILVPEMFQGMQRHGNSRWNPVHFVGLVVLASVCEGKQLTEAFKKAKSVALDFFGSLAIHTYQGMMRALVSNHKELVSRLWSRLQTLMEQTAPACFRIGRWCPLAVDGSRFSTRRSRGNEHAFSAKNYGKGRAAKSRQHWKNKNKRSKKLATLKPQIWLTLIWHMGLKLPWCWKKGASNSSERHHMMDMLKSMNFPENTLFCCDAGFVGYELWSAIINSGNSFLLRVGGNVRLLKKLAKISGRRDMVWVWPREAMKRNQPAIALRLITIHDGRGTMYLVTNVLNERQLSMKMIRQLYPLRWGIELHFRATKQTFERGTLRSLNSDNCLVELDWSLIALTMVQLIAIREQVKLDIPPEHTSIARALKAVRFALFTRHSKSASLTPFNDELSNAVLDGYIRKGSKQGRYRPNKKKKPSATKPVLTYATTEQKHRYAELSQAA